jgi:UDP-N-acetylmuramyl pentapeptide phosphotransferase/UDP-N-acetylglucosamine-1-phosphate transferase
MVARVFDALAQSLGATTQLLGAMAVAFVVTIAACFIILRIFPWFRSGERKEGHFRADQSTGSYHVDARNGLRKLRVTRADSHELPLLGGPAMIVGVVVASIITGVVLNLDDQSWKLLATVLVAAVGYGAVGFVDDWRKVHLDAGLTEIQKAAGVLLVSLGAAVALNRYIVTGPLSARFAYPPYSDFPLLGTLLKDAHFAWIIFFLLMTATVASATSLAVDFSDGLDGLCGGLLLSAALSFAAILLGEGAPDLWAPAIVVLAIAGAAAGYLPFNWPSSWKARGAGRGRRRAALIMGDSGSLAMGGILALVAVIARLEFVLLFIGGVFVLEGVSALVSARILVRFFRRFLYMERFGASRGFAHTELPLPFLATPMHHHYDLLGWDRKRLVYGAWLLGAGLGLLGVASVIGTFTWERYLARFAALLVIIMVWQIGPWTRSYFIGLTRATKAAPESRHLALYYGYPFRLFGRPLSSQVDVTSVTPEALDTPAEKLTLWQRISGFDARSILGYYCYRTGDFDDALRIWAKIPRANLEKRPEIAEMLAEVRHAIALRATDALDQPVPLAQDVDAEPTPAATEPPQFDPGAIWPPLHPEDPNASLWRSPVPPAGTLATTRLEPAGEALPPPADVDARLPATPSTPLWSASVWTAAMSGESTGQKAVLRLDTDQPDSLEPATNTESTSAEPAQEEREPEPASEISGGRNPQPFTQS